MDGVIGDNIGRTGWHAFMLVLTSMSIPTLVIFMLSFLHGKNQEALLLE